MRLTIDKAKVSELKPNLPAPNLGFILEAIAHGTGYKFGDGGYFIVSDEHSILPRFVVDLRLPELPNLASFKWVVVQMLKHSSGMLFIDSSSSDAFALAWKLQLPVLPGSPLFQYVPEAPKYSGKSDAVHEATSRDRDYVAKLLTSVPRQLGGAREEDVNGYIQSKHAYILEKNGKKAGAAVVVPQGDVYSWVEALVLDPSVRHSAAGYTVLERLAIDIRQEGRRLIFGMSHKGTAEYTGAVKLGSAMIKQSWHAFLPSVCQDFQMKISYS